MAYADTTTTGRTLGTGAAVLLIEAGLAAALIAGLAATYTVKSEPNPTAINIPLPKPSPPPPQVERPRPDRQSAADRPEPLVKLPPVNSGPITVVEVPAGGGAGTAGLGDAAFPDPTPSPTTTPPLFKPRAAVPRGKWQAWVTTSDYPTRDLREENQGTARYRLAIDAAGKVTGCTITASSGHPRLDRATCDTVQRRARFDPATDETGARAAGSFSGSVTWQIPQE